MTRGLARRRAESAISWRTALAAAVMQALAAGAFAGTADTDIGRQIYLEGRAGSTPISAHRAGGLESVGASAACVNCHRRSGMGGSEGRTYVPPIDATALFTNFPPGSGAAARGAGRKPYTESSLLLALNQGQDPTGRTLDYLMPRYQLSPDQARSLTDYLRTLGKPAADAGGAGVVHLATVFAGDVAPEQRRIAESTLRACIADHNAGPVGAGRRKLLGAQMQRSVPQPWALHIWELTGPASSWDAQLRAHAQRQPVFAMLGGLVGSVRGSDWAPVQQFCEREAIACLYPHVAAPPAAENNHYSIYTNAGVHLEAALIAQHLLEAAPRRVVQWLRAGDDAAQSGADALQKTLVARGVDVAQHHAEVDAPEHGPAQVLWLRAADLQRFATPPPHTTPYLSATLLAHRLDDVPLALRGAAIVAHPHELGPRRAARISLLDAWLARQGLRLEDAALQADIYMACNALDNGLNEIAQRPGADYLIERLEVITERRGFNGLYPRISLGAGQRFASKTGYLVRFVGAELRDIEALGESIAP